MKAQVLTKTVPVEQSPLELADLPVPSRICRTFVGTATSTTLNSKPTSVLPVNIESDSAYLPKGQMWQIGLMLLVAGVVRSCGMLGP